MLKLIVRRSLLLAVSVGAGHAQAVCFGTVSEALAGHGTPMADGFRLEAIMQDPLSGKRWAKVERCAHPEWPALLVAASERDPAEATIARGHAARNEAAAPLRTEGVPSQTLANAGQGVVSNAPTQPAVRAGETVTVVERTSLVQLEVAGVALNSGRAGEAVKVRVGRLNSGAPQVVLGTARGRGLVELVDGVVEQR